MNALFSEAIRKQQHLRVKSPQHPESGTGQHESGRNFPKVRVREIGLGRAGPEPERGRDARTVGVAEEAGPAKGRQDGLQEEVWNHPKTLSRWLINQSWPYTAIILVKERKKIECMRFDRVRSRGFPWKVFERIRQRKKKDWVFRFDLICENKSMRRWRT